MVSMNTFHAVLFLMIAHPHDGPFFLSQLFVKRLELETG